MLEVCGEEAAGIRHLGAAAAPPTAGPSAAIAAVSVLAAPRYHEMVVDHYDSSRNVGSFDKNDPSVPTGLVGAPACGDVMKLQIKVEVSGKIMDACFKTRAAAASSVATG